MKSAKKQTEQPAMHLRIIGATAEDNKISRLHKESPYTNGGIVIMTNPHNERKMVLTDKVTKRTVSQPELIPLCAIREGSHMDIPFSLEPLRYFSRITNNDQNKRHMYEKRLDYWSVSNPSWRVMDMPSYMRGIDFTEPGLW